MKRTFSAGLACALVVIAGCGGGGDAGQSDFTRPTDTFNARAAWVQLIGGTHSWSVAGTGSDGRNYTLGLSTASAAAAVFPPTGVSGSVTNLNLSLTQSGGGSATGLTEVFHGSTYLVEGVRYSTVPASGVACELITAGTAKLPPTAVKIDVADQSGPLYAGASLPNCSNTASSGTVTATWSVEFVAGITYFCVNSVERDLTTAANIVSSEKDCVQMAANGTLGTRARVDVTTDGLRIVAGN